jgi:hypothetical protein
VGAVAKSSDVRGIGYAVPVKHTRFVVTVATISAIALLALLVACSKSETPVTTPPAARASCSADADCEVTNFGGCCACCESSAHAVPAIALSQERARCAIKDCEVKCSPNTECAKIEPAAAFTARCKDGTCTAVRR